MINKQTFGAFIREKRLEKKLTQKELAEQLFVSESAISKWEMGKSYPDITLIPDLCKALDISEREMIAGATDTEYRIMKNEARLYRRISEAWFWSFTIGYIAAMVICIICDLAVNHRPTFSVIVFASLLLAYSFVPTWIRFSKKHKLTLFVGTSYLSLVFLFLICCLRFHQSWFGIASAAVLLGYIVCFGPFLIRRYLPERYGKLSLPLYFGVVYISLLLLLSVIRITVGYPLWKGILISIYTYIPFIIISAIHLLNMNRYFKAAVDIIAFGLIGYGMQWWINRIIGGNTPQYYRVDFTDWINCVNGNITLSALILAIAISAVLTTIGIYQTKRNKRA